MFELYNLMIKQITVLQQQGCLYNFYKLYIKYFAVSLSSKYWKIVVYSRVFIWFTVDFT